MNRDEAMEALIDIFSKDTDEARGNLYAAAVRDEEMLCGEFSGSFRRDGKC